ncbi:MAG: 6-phosphofructokinase [Planctomycetia bacterium]|nr:6-phosphofructokinase [Planctomycetia bacterium]
MSLQSPRTLTTSIKKVAILFAGGPAPGANAVISTAAASFLRNGMEVIGIRHGYSGLVEYGPNNPMTEGKDFIALTHKVLRRTRSSQGIIIGTARTNPGKRISHPSHLQDAERSAPLKTVYEALVSLGVDALVSIGGDDTLKTANKLQMYQRTLPAGSKQIPVVHLPKTIDNDYLGIDFTFGYFTAVETLASEVRNLLADAEAGRNYFLVESMGRSAGWLAYGVAIAGEASLVISVEDIHDKYRSQETYKDEETGESKTRDVMNVDEVIRRIVRTMLARDREGKEFGVIVVAEGLAELLPQRFLAGVSRDDHGHIAISQLNLGRTLSKLIADEYKKATGGKSRKIVGLQLGYEARCARPHAFDVMLGSQLGVGAYRALVEKGLSGVMVSITGQFALHFVPFEQLVDQETLVTTVRFVERDSDFHQLARFLETYINEEPSR